jgi:hypothetical protein
VVEGRATVVGGTVVATVAGIVVVELVVLGVGGTSELCGSPATPTAMITDMTRPITARPKGDLKVRRILVLFS